MEAFVTMFSEAKVTEFNRMSDVFAGNLQRTGKNRWLKDDTCYEDVKHRWPGFSYPFFEVQ